MSEENEFNMYKNIVNNYFRTETFEKAKEFCARDMVQLNQRYITEAICRNEDLNRADKLQKENKELKELNNKLKRENEALEIIHETYKEVLKELLGEENGKLE